MTSSVVIAALLTILFTGPSWGQEAAAPSLDDALGGTLEDLLNIKTAVASKKEIGQRATPGVVTIISDEDIRNMGARDLIDVLRTVPSLNFGTDVQGVVGLGVRGMWAHEGKFLFLIDGIEMNEIQYATNQFGNRYPVDQIKRIEIIRGPGSAIYGGFAELAVINVITKSGADIGGARAQYTGGVMAGGSRRDNTSLALGRKSGDWDYSVSGYVGSTNRGEGSYTWTDGLTYGSYDMADADQLQPHYVNAGLSNGALNFRFIYDEYKITSRSQYGGSDTSGGESIANLFKSMNFAASYAYKLNDAITLTPFAHHYTQHPWLQDTAEAVATGQFADIESTRFKSGITMSYDVAPNLNLLTGYEYIRDQNQRDDSNTFSDGSSKLDLYNNALLAQAVYEASFANFTVGARYDDPSRTDSSFVPRFAITRAEKYWHGKFLYSNAFRSPVLYNIDSDSQIRPEKTQTFEFESGYGTSSNSYLTGNIFYSKIKDPIIYDSTTVPNYSNQGNVATKGLELDWRYKMSRGQFQLGYSYYIVDTNKASTYQLTSDDDSMIGMPQHKVVLNGTTYLNSANDFKLGTTLIYHSQKWAFDADEASLTYVEKELDSLFRLNAYLSKENLFLDGFGAGLGIYNIFNSRDTLVQPYNGGHGPLPGPSREIFARIDYQLGF